MVPYKWFYNCEEVILNPRRNYKTTDNLVFWGFLALLFWLPLPWASHVPWAEALFAFLIFLLMSLWFGLAVLGHAHFDHSRSRRLFWPLAIWLAWLVWVGMQTISLDFAILEKYSPQAADLYQSVADIGLVAANCISICKGVTVDSLILSAGYFGVYWLVVLTCWHRPERIRVILGVLVISGLFQALYGSLMTLSGVEYGFLTKKVHYLGYATGTFVNRNHLAGYLELTAACGIGLILADFKATRENRTWEQWLRDVVSLLLSSKVRVRIALAIMAVGVVMTRSRMGNIAFFSSLCICGMGYILLRERQLALKASLFFISVLLIDVLIINNWFGLEAVVQRIEKTEVATEGRTHLFEALPPVVAAYSKTGSGLGTFAQAFAPHRTAAMKEYFDHAHNDYLQFIIEAGLPGFFILLTFVGAHALHALVVIVKRRSRLPAAVCFSTLMALVAYAIHATVEFNLQIPANAATFVVLLALCACCSSQSRSKKSRAVSTETDQASNRQATPQAV